MREPKAGNIRSCLLPAMFFVLSSFFGNLVTVAAKPVFMDFTNAPASASAIVTEPEPRSTREIFNLGTRKLRAGQLAEAETRFQQVLQAQEEKLQPAALYNLGHTRFEQGALELKKSSDPAQVAARGRAAAQTADRAADRARDAALGNDLPEMLAAYVNGRGARRELKAATEAVKRALELHGAALRKWQRSAADFRSAAELNPKDTNALRNAQLVEGEIAKLVDSIREMQQAQQAMAQSRQGLQEMMRQLGGRIPESMMPPGARGEDEEDEEGENGDEEPPEQTPGLQQGKGREGDEMKLTPEEAGWILDSLKGDSDRRLPMGQGDTSEPRNKDRTRTW